MRKHLLATLPLFVLAGDASAAGLVLKKPLPPPVPAPAPPPVVKAPPPCDSTYKADDGTTICVQRDSYGRPTSIFGTDAAGRKRTLSYGYINDGGEHLIEIQYFENNVLIVTARHKRPVGGGLETNDILFEGGWHAHYEVSPSSAYSYALDQQGQKYFEVIGPVDFTRTGDAAFPPHYFDYLQTSVAPALDRANYLGPVFDGYVPYNARACGILSRIAGGLACLETGFKDRGGVGCGALLTGFLDELCNDLDEWGGTIGGKSGSSSTPNGPNGSQQTPSPQPPPKPVVIVQCDENGNNCKELK